MYKPEWEEKYHWVKSHPIDTSLAICIVCPAAFSISKGMCKLCSVLFGLHSTRIYIVEEEILYCFVVVKYFSGECQLRRHEGVTHATAIQKIEAKFGSDLSREQLINVMFSPTNRVVQSNNFQYHTEAFEAMHVYHAVVHSQSYKSLDRLMKLQTFLLCDKMQAFDKRIRCGEMKSRAIVSGVLSDFCFKMVNILFNLI